MINANASISNKIPAVFFLIVSSAFRFLAIDSAREDFPVEMLSVPS